MQLSPEQRAQIIVLHRQKFSTRKIAEIICTTQPTVVNTIKKYNEFESFEHKGMNGRPKKLTDPIIAEISAINDTDKKTSLRKMAVQVSKNNDISISYGSIRNCLHNLGIYAYSPIKKPLLKQSHIEKRFDMSKQWIKMTEEAVKQIVFSDETKINLYYSDGNLSVWRKPKCGLDIDSIKPTVKFGGGSIMVWGCFSYYGTGELYFIEDIMDAPMYCNILSSALFRSIEKMKLKDYIFMQDNDPKHTSKLVKEFLSEKNIKTLDWPAQSPDCNPIENMWRIIKLEVSKSQPKTKRELKEAVINAWNNITIEQCQKLALSFKKRAIELYRAKGKHINY